MNRLDQITFLRFVAVILVLLTHGLGSFYISFTESLGIPRVLYNLAPIGVAALYMLSGFVISFAYFQPDKPFNIIDYLRARFIRVYPLYIIAFVLICYYYRDALLRINPQKILANLFLVQAWFQAYAQSFNYPSWSVSVEVFFYVLFPFWAIWAYRLSTKKIIGTTLGFWVVTQAIHYFLWMFYLTENRAFVLYFPLIHISTFLVGASAGVWYKRVGVHLTVKPVTILWMLFFSISLIVGYVVVATYYVPNLPSGMQALAGLFAPLSALIIVLLALDNSRISSILSNPVFVALGEGAYALYILHIPLSWNMEAFLESVPIANWKFYFDIVFLPALIVISVITHYYLDVPLRNWLKNVLQRVNLFLLLTDLLIIIVSVHWSFLLRFDHPREYASYQEIGRLIFYTAFFIRPILGIIFGTYRFETINQPLKKLLGSIFISTALSSLVISIIAYFGYIYGLSINFPRSIFVIDWLIVFLISLLSRLIYRTYLNRISISVSSEQGISHAK